MIGRRTRWSRRDAQTLIGYIAMKVRRGLPGPQATEGLTESVENALVLEARVNERALANLRVGVLALALIAQFAVYLRPAAVGLPGYPIAPVVITTAWLVFAGFMMLQVRSGHYDLRMRYIVPAVDALFLAAAGLVQFAAIDSWWPRFQVGVVVMVATACAALVLTGSLRLSAGPARLATLLALSVWALFAYVTGCTALLGSFVAAALICTHAAGSRLTHLNIRILATELGRARLGLLYEDAREAIVAREQVLRIVSHDLRNPLNTIGMTAELLLTTPLTEEQTRRKLEVTRKAVHQMKTLIEGLLDVARVEAGTLRIEPTRTGIARVVHESVQLMQPIADAAGVSLRPQVEDDAVVHADVERLMQVFSNLVGNAIKFTPAGGTVCVSAALHGQRVRLAVADTGSGIPAEDIEQIFSGFWQARPNERRGIGLGLTIARAIVEAHGEKLAVTSAVGEGTTFWFELPAVQPATLSGAGR